MQKKDNLITIPTAIVIAGLIIAGAVIYNKPASTEVAKAQAPAGGQNVPVNINAVTSSDHLRGNINAPVTVVEFSDLECPFCKSFHTTMERIMTDYGATGKVAWVYRHFPLDQIHPKTRKEAEASECAFEQGGDTQFWAYIDKIFEITPSNNQLDPAQLPVVAKVTGLDMTKFTTCLASGKFAGKIEKQYQDGLRVGIGTVPGSGTPYSIIIDKKGNKIPVSGAQPYEVVKQLIDAILADNK